MPKKSFIVFPITVLGIFLIPILAGLFGTWLPALGYLPAIGGDSFSFSPISKFFSYPGLGSAIQVTLFSSLLASCTALFIAFWLTMSLYESRMWRYLKIAISPLLAIPHASFAIGLSFLFIPSGTISRLLSTFVPFVDFTHNSIFWGDQYGLSLALVLAIKEIPFLLMVIISVLPQLKIPKVLWLGKSLGYSSPQIWFRLILPLLYPHLRLPFLAILAYSLSVVDIAQIAGPSLPPSLAVLIDSWFHHVNVDYRLLGAVGASFLGFLVLFVMTIVLILERFWTTFSKSSLVNGRRNSYLYYFDTVAKLTFIIITGLFFGSFLVLLIQSFAFRWPFPQIIPESFTTAYWAKSFVTIQEPLTTSLILGIASTLISLFFAIGCLESQVHRRSLQLSSISNKFLILIYVPLFIPQISFLFGMQIIAVNYELDGSYLALILTHVIFVLPYVFLTLANPYLNYDERYSNIGLSLGKSACYTFVRVKLPILLKPIVFSFAIGFSVSIVQYLPTLYIGAGRFVTITTETVALASGSDKRIAAIYAVLQLLLPLFVFCLALGLPRLLHGNRLAMKS